MTEEELKELEAALGSFLTFPDRWEKVECENGDTGYRYVSNYAMTAGEEKEE